MIALFADPPDLRQLFTCGHKRVLRNSYRSVSPSHSASHEHCRPEVSAESCVDIHPDLGSEVAELCFAVEKQSLFVGVYVFEEKRRLSVTEFDPMVLDSAPGICLDAANGCWSPVDSLLNRFRWRCAAAPRLRKFI